MIFSNYDPHNPNIITPPEPLEEHYVNCSECGEPIYYWEGGQDGCIEIDGDCVCDDCIKTYMKRNYFKKLEVTQSA